MYTPKHFKEDRLPVLHAAIDAAGPATLVTVGSNGIEASHLPLFLDAERGPNGTLYGHFSRANAQWRNFDAAFPALAVFQGVDAYVSPSWYTSKAEHGKVVPTWDYVAVHAYGPLTLIEEPDALLRLVTRLTEKHEAKLPRPWKVSDAPDDYIANHLKGIIGFSMRIERLEGQWKLSQNKSHADYQGVIDGLKAREEPDAIHTAEAMDEVRPEHHKIAEAKV